MRETEFFTSLPVREAEHPRTTGKREMENISEEWIDLWRVKSSLIVAH